MGMQTHLLAPRQRQGHGPAHSHLSSALLAEPSRSRGHLLLVASEDKSAAPVPLATWRRCTGGVLALVFVSDEYEREIFVISFTTYHDSNLSLRRYRVCE